MSAVDGRFAVSHRVGRVLTCRRLRRRRQVVEEALKKTPGNPDLEEELRKSRDEMSAALRDKGESEAAQRLSAAQQHHAFFVKEQFEDRQERVTFRKISFWQHMATYLLYFVMLMNIFITTFGISRGASSAAAPADVNSSRT